MANKTQREEENATRNLHLAELDRCSYSWYNEEKKGADLMKGKKRVERLTPRMAAPYQALRDLEGRLGAPPSVREVVQHLGLERKHISRVHGDLSTLEEMGLAQKLEIPTRCFKVPDGAPHPDDIDWESLILNLK